MARQKNETIVRDENKKTDVAVADLTDTQDEAEKPATTATAEQATEDKPVAPKERYGYSRFAQFPVEMTLPMRVLAEAGVANRRYQILTSGQDVPEAIIRWMKTDIRYNRWFA